MLHTHLLVEEEDIFLSSGDVQAKGRLPAKEEPSENSWTNAYCEKNWDFGFFFTEINLSLNSIFHDYLEEPSWSSD